MTSDDAGHGLAHDEHLRFARHLEALALVDGEGEAELVAAVLRDPDPVMAESAVARHLDRRAAELVSSSGQRFEDWVRAMAAEVNGRAFLDRRLGEWALLRSIAVGGPWSPEEVIAASDWFQRKAAETVASPEVLSVLADKGRTRRVRAAAGRRLG